MRNKEQFKAYVYEKADVARVQNKRIHAAWARGAVAFSLLVVVGGAFLYANGNSTDNAMAPIMTGTVNESAKLMVLDAETGAPAETCDYANLADAISAEESGEKLLVTGAETESAYKATAETMAVQYSYVVTAASASMKTEYTVASNASEYSGDLTNIDFSKNVALVFTAQAAIASWEITYGEDTIVITLTAEDGEKRDSVYTILLEKEKYLGQKIEIHYQ